MRVRPLTIIGALAIAANIMCSASPACAAQTATRVTNADVVAMTTAKLSDEVVISGLQQAATSGFRPFS